MEDFKPVVRRGVPSTQLRGAKGRFGGKVPADRSVDIGNPGQLREALVEKRAERAEYLSALEDDIISQPAPQPFARRDSFDEAVKQAMIDDARDASLEAARRRRIRLRITRDYAITIAILIVAYFAIQFFAR